MSCIFVARTEQSSDTSKNLSLIKGFVEAENKKFKLLLSVSSSVLSTKCVNTEHYEGFPGQS